MTDKLKALDLFSGIGGISLGLERAGGFETVAFCEIEEFQRKVLKKHWPEVPCYEDVTKLTGDILKRDGISVDVLTGGFPCQDVSVAGPRRGIGEGTRSGLWSEIKRLTGELRPKFIVLENVTGLLSGPSEKRGGWFGRILGDLAELGYDAEWEVLPAAIVGAPHMRKRIIIVAYPCSDGLETQGYKAVLRLAAFNAWKDGYSAAMGGASNWNGTRPCVARSVEVDHGFSDAVGIIKSFGNAVVPQIFEIVGRAIMEIEANDG